MGRRVKAAHLAKTAHHQVRKAKGKATEKVKARHAHRIKAAKRK